MANLYLIQSVLLAVAPTIRARRSIAPPTLSASSLLLLFFLW